MIEQNKLNLASEVQMECLRFCFSGLPQTVLNEFKEHWNTHYIRASWHDTIQGRPDSLYYISEFHGAASDYVLPVPKDEMVYAQNELVECVEEKYVHQ